MTAYFNSIRESRYIIAYLVKLDLKSRYRNSLLGVVWNLLTPLGFVTIIGLVFGILFQVDIRVFIPFLFSGLIPWFFITACGDGGAQCFLQSQGYIKQISIPLEVFPVRVVLSALINLLMTIAAFWIICLFLNPSVFSWRVILLFPTFIIFIVFGISLATIAGFVQTYMRDYAPTQSLAFQALFFATPIKFPAEDLYATPAFFIVRYNPFRYMIDIFRSPLLGVETQSPYSYVVSIIFTLLVFIFAQMLNRKIGRKIAFRL